MVAAVVLNANIALRFPTTSPRHSEGTNSANSVLNATFKNVTGADITRVIIMITQISTAGCSHQASGMIAAYPILCQKADQKEILMSGFPSTHLPAGRERNKFINAGPAVNKLT